MVNDDWLNYELLMNRHICRNYVVDCVTKMEELRRGDCDVNEVITQVRRQEKEIICT